MWLLNPINILQNQAIVTFYFLKWVLMSYFQLNHPELVNNFVQENVLVSGRLNLFKIVINLEYLENSTCKSFMNLLFEILRKEKNQISLVFLLWINLSILRHLDPWLSKLKSILVNSQRFNMFHLSQIIILLNVASYFIKL